MTRPSIRSLRASGLTTSEIMEFLDREEAQEAAARRERRRQKQLMGRGHSRLSRQEMIAMLDNPQGGVQ